MGAPSRPRLPVMKQWLRSHLALVVGAAAGMGAIVGLLLIANPSRVWHIVLTTGWWIPVLALVHAVFVYLLTRAWRSLLLGVEIDAPFWEIFRFRWIADAANALTPFLAADGEVLRGYLQAKETDVDGPMAAAVIIVDLTARMVSLAVFVSVGMILFLVSGRPHVWLIAGGTSLLLFVFLGGYYYAQRHGGLQKIAHLLWKWARSDHWREFAGQAEEAGERLQRVYQNRRAFFRSAVWHFAAWVYGGAEMVLVLWILGHSVGPMDGWIFESIGAAAHNAGFFLPASLGAAEGGYLLGARAIGLSSALGVGVAIIKRIRDIVFGAPALVLWQRIRKRERERA